MGTNLSKILRERNLSVDISPRDLFLSVEFRKYFEKMAEGVTERYTNPPTVETVDEGENRSAAYTNGDVIHLNVTNDLVDYAETMFDRFRIMLGLGFHETAHVVFTDFDREKILIDQIAVEGKLPVSPGFICPDSTGMEEISTKLQNKPAYRKFFATLYDKLANFADDTHDEEALIAAYRWSGRGERPSLIQECIHVIRSVLRKNTVSVEEVLKQEEGNITYKVMMSLIFHYIRFGQFIYADPANENNEVRKAFAPFEADARLIATTDSVDERFDGITRIVLNLWPFIKAKLPDDTPPDQQQQQNGQDGSQGQQGSGDNAENDSRGDGQGQGDDGQQSGEAPSDDHDDGTDKGQVPGDGDGQEKSEQDAGGQGEGSEGQGMDGSAQPSSQGGGSDELQDLMNDLNDAANQANETATPKNRQSSKAVTQRGEKPSDQGSDGQSKPKQSQDNEQEPGDGSPKNAGAETDSDQEPGDDKGSDLLKMTLNQILNDLSKQKAEELANDALSQELNHDIETVNACGPHSSCEVIQSRVGDPSDRAIAAYNKAHKITSSYSKRLARLIEQELIDQELGGVIRHKAFGRSFDVRDAFRPDEKFFCRKKKPTDRPEIAVTLLLDLSGSMNREDRIDYAKKAAVMLYDFCMELKIPCMVCGHNSDISRNEWCFYTATLFEQASSKDRYRIMELRAFDANRDGAAVQVAEGLLGKRPEEVKLCFVISDGRPNAFRYGGAAAEEDIKHIVAENRRKYGVETFALGIGDDKENLQRIYGDAFMSIDDLSTLPTSLVKTLKKRILAKH